ncbi:Cof-type HAD-IIB family hydrolase [Enemella sp. A6]|uniref:Cof-type HAD-IIB family hydrolase n=1 Tax=Enemella sp. A6 TaxID=3440152 RepID=UPI003EB8EAD8
MPDLPYRAVAIDIDGTLLSSRKVVLPSTVEWIARARAAGAHVMISSGRPISGIRGQVERGGLTTPLALSGYNGAIARTSDDEVFVDHRMPAETAREVLRFAHHRPGSRMACVDDRLIADDPNGLLVRQEIEGNLMTPEVIPDLNEVDEPMHKLLFVGSADDTVMTEQALLDEFGDRLAITRSAPIYCEVSMPEATKGGSLQAYCDYYDIPIEQSIVFGDAHNDLAMLRAAGLGVAMGNAHDDVKAAADRVTASHDDDGIALVLEEFFG